MISAEAAAKALGMMSLMKFFPGDEETRAALMELLSEMCGSDEQVIWLGRRMTVLYTEWPGALELRAAFCSKYRPLDGLEAYSDLYPDGIPSEQEPPKALPPGPQRAEVEGIMNSLVVRSERIPPAKVANKSPHVKTAEQAWGTKGAEIARKELKGV